MTLSLVGEGHCPWPYRLRGRRDRDDAALDERRVFDLSPFFHRVGSRACWSFEAQCHGAHGSEADKEKLIKIAAPAAPQRPKP